MKKNTRGRLLDAAEPEMLAKGYSATTVDEICERAGVSKGSFYHLFATKEDLGLALLDAHFERNLGIATEPLATPGDARARAVALADHLVSSAGVLWGGGCLLGAFALELAKTNPAMAAAVSLFLQPKINRLVGLVALSDAVASLDCDLSRMGHAGTHQAVLGRCVRVREGDGPALLYTERRYGSALVESPRNAATLHHHLGKEEEVA